MSKIIGNTTTTPVPRSDWSQTDKTKVDYIRNKPKLGTISEKDIVDKVDLTTEVQTSLDQIDTKASVMTLTTEEYNALETSGKTDANTLYMLTDDDGVVQPDMAQNDPSAADYIKNRTHYVEKGEEVFIEEQTFTLEDGVVVTEWTEPLVEGDTYIVKWDGVEYTSVAKSYTFEGSTFVCIGNLVVIGEEDNGIPFYATTDGVFILIDYDETATERTVGVIHRYEKYHQLDPKFVPNLPYKELQTVFPETVLEWNEDVGGFIATTDFVLEAGKTYTVTHNGVEYSCTTEEFQGIPLIGDFNAITTGTPSGSFPFVIITMENAIALMPLNSDETHTIKISEEVYHQLDPKFVPNLPYTEEIEELIVEEAVYSFDPDWGAYTFQGLTLTEGDTYIVRWNDVEYKCVAELAEVIPGTSVICIGNPCLDGIGGEDNGMPFQAMDMFPVVGIKGIAFNSINDELPDTKIGVVHKYTKYHQIDPKFVPNLPYEEWEVWFPRTQQGDEWNDEDGSYTDCNNSFYGPEIIKKYFTVGKKYKVVIDDVYEFITTAYWSEDDGGTVLYKDDEEGYFFMLIQCEDGRYMGMDWQWAVPDQREVSSLEIFESVVHQIDPKFVPNLPYEEILGTKILIPDGTEITTTQSGDFAIYTANETPLTLVAGYTYKVSFDGTVYECVAREVDMYGNVFITIGNSTIVPIYEANSEGNGEPFYLISPSKGNFMFITPTAGTYYIGMTECKSEIHKLDEKFIPDSIARVSDISLSNPLTINGIVYDGSEAVTVTTPTGLPTITTSDNGAFLRVVNGKWTTSKLPNAEDGEF